MDLILLDIQIAAVHLTGLPFAISPSRKWRQQRDRIIPCQGCIPVYDLFVYRNDIGRIRQCRIALIQLRHQLAGIRHTFYVDGTGSQYICQLSKHNNLYRHKMILQFHKIT
jgi:hypothetical protein